MPGSRSDGPDDQVIYGGTIEKVVLARSLRDHLEDRVLLYRTKTVILRPGGVHARRPR